MPKTILVVDDDAEFREEFRDFLDEYTVIEAANGQQALNLLRKPNTIDVVILDVMMPGQRGTQVLQEMRKIAPDLGIIMLTGFSSKDVAVEALKGRADDYIEKPIDVTHVRATIEAVLRAKSPQDVVHGDDLQARIQRVKEFAERNSLKKFGLNEAAEVACLSPKYLSRVFKQEVGMGFNQYRLQLKLEKAKDMLEHSGLTIGQISEELGYQNQETFLRLFKRMTGTTPREYRQTFRRRESVSR